MTDKETLTVYGEKAGDYADLLRKEGRNRHIDDFLTHIPEGGRVLDWGCGAGTASNQMIQSGYQVIATDASSEFAAVAQARFGMDVRVETFDALDERDLYDGIVASFSLLHARKTAMPGHLSQARRAIKLGGWLYLGLKVGDGEARDGIGRFYAYYQEDETRALLASAGFEAKHASYGSSPGLDGVDWPWMILFAEAIEIN